MRMLLDKNRDTISSVEGTPVRPLQEDVVYDQRVLQEGEVALDTVLLPVAASTSSGEWAISAAAGVLVRRTKHRGFYASVEEL